MGRCRGDGWVGSVFYTMIGNLLNFFFFFSSRRRHTRLVSDWSSDVCSSDLPPLFLLTISRCGSAPSFYTVHFSLRQRPRFLYCPFLVAAAPRLFILPGFCCGSAPGFYTALFSLQQRPTFYTARFSMRQIGRAHV